jgi:hypothetical protein
MHLGQDYRAQFGLRQTGTGPYAQQIARRFELALKRLGLNERRHTLRTDLFVRPLRQQHARRSDPRPADGRQLELF